MSDRADAGIMTMPRRRRCGLTLDRALRIFSSFLIPLLLSIFTVVIAVYQQKVAANNRLIDIQNAKLQRNEDYKLAEQQQNIDYNISVQQRLEDRQAREKQRQQDKETAHLQRQTDINLTSSQLDQETFLDEQLRSITEKERQTNFQLSQNRKQEDTLQKFVRDMSLLMINSNNTMSLNMLYTIRWKILVAIRQLDSKRKTLIFNNLQEIALLDLYYQDNYTTPIDLSEGHFDGLDLSSEPIEQSRSLSFRGMSLINAKFDLNHLSGSDFSLTKLIGTSFKYSLLNESTFYSSDLTNSSFLRAQLQDCDFTDAILIDSDINEEQLNSITFLDGAILDLQDEKFEDSNILWIYPSNDQNRNLIRPYNKYHQGNVSDIWYIYKDINIDQKGDIHQKGQWGFEVLSQDRVSLKTNFKRRIPIIYHKWIKQNNYFNMRIKTECGTYGDDINISYFISHYHIDKNSSFANFSFGPISGIRPVQSIDYIPISSDLEYDLEFLFERSKPIQSLEKIAFCENVHLSFVNKHSQILTR